MSKKLIATLTLTFIICFSFILKINAASNGVSKTYTNYFTTIVTFIFRDVDEVPEAHWNLIENELQHIQDTFSRTDSTSELYKLNQKAGIEPFKASDDLYYLVKKAVEYAELTKGKFEPTIGPLIDLWGPINQDIIVPTEEEINQIKPLINYQLIEFNDENQTIYLPKKGMQIDLGAISKGYAADKIASIIRDLDYEHVIINLGGNVLTIGTRDAKNYYGTNDWALGLSNPKYNQDLSETRTYAEILVTNKTIVSSGTYERAWYSGNKKYHHILNPETGFPVDNDVEMVTIITENSTAADALSTSVLALGIEDGLDLIESLPGVEAIYVTYDKKVYPSSGIGDDIKLYIVNDTFTFAEDSNNPNPDHGDGEPTIPDPDPNPDPVPNPTQEDNNNSITSILVAGLIVIFITTTGIVIKKTIK
jgi:FAD:protein FMN transferase